MELNKLLYEQKEILNPDKKTLVLLKERTNNLLTLLKEEISKAKIIAEPFVGGSFAKGTLLNEKGYDVDIFLRFDWRAEHLSDKLKEIIYNLNKKLKYELNEVHGSRDYFKLNSPQGITFEIVPVYKIKHPREARNVTDLSYFHVNYIRKKLKGDNIKKEVLLAKRFCSVQGVYGAESYIQGFSGYGLECLIGYYKTFLRMLRELSASDERIIIDPENLYKKKEEILFSLNESKLNSPIILIDPTWKERNVLAALSFETFKKFQVAAKSFLKKPSADFFDFNDSDIKINKSSGEFIQLKISTDKQEGDIAGTKMKKFARHLKEEISKYFFIEAEQFSYSAGQESDFYLSLKSKKEIIKAGPPISMKDSVFSFKAKNKNIFEKKGRIYSKELINFTAKDFINQFIKENKQKIIEMSIKEIKLVK